MSYISLLRRSINRSVGVFLLSACTAGTMYAETTVQWVPGATSLGEGIVTVEYDTNGQVTNLYVQTSGGLVTLAGTEAIPFAADAVLGVAGGTLRVETPVVGAGNLSVTTAESGFVYESPGANGVLPEAEADAVVIAHNVSLDRLRVDHAYYDKKSVTEVCIGNTTVGLPFHEVRGEGTYSCQMQAIDGGWNKCVFLSLKQVGDDIVAWTPKARYDAESTYGKDFSASPGNPFNLWQPGETESGYAIDLVRMASLNFDPATVVFTKTVDVVGTLCAALDTDVIAEGEAALSDDFEWNHTVQIDGAFTLRNLPARRIGGQFTFGPYGALNVVADGAHAETPTELRLEKDLPGTEWAVVARGVSILAITNVTAAIGRKSWFGEAGAPLGTYRFTRSQNKKEISCQFQYYDGSQYVKGVAYALRQVNDDIEARVVKAGYWQSAGDDVGQRDVTTQNDMAVDTGVDNGYGIGNIRLHFGGTPYGRYMELAPMVVNGAKGKMSLRGSASERLYVKGLNPRVMDVPLSVWTNAVCLYDPTNANTAVSFGGGLTYSFNEGGEFWQCVDWSFSQTAVFSISGGVFRVAHDKTSAADTIAPIYVEKVTFEDGGRLVNHPPRTGYYLDPVWTVKGSHPAYIEPGLGIVGHEAAAFRTATFAVEDVTGDDRPDLYIGGRLFYSNAQWANAKMVKTGPGTVSHAAANTVTNYPFVLQGGFWELAATGSMTMDNAVTLEGGGLSLVDGCTNAVGTLSVADGLTAEVRIGENAELDLGALDLGGDSRLNVTMPRESSLRVGTTQCLTATQIRAIRMNGERVHQRADGYVREGVGGVVIYIR